MDDYGTQVDPVCLWYAALSTIYQKPNVRCAATGLGEPGWLEIEWLMPISRDDLLVVFG